MSTQEYHAKAAAPNLGQVLHPMIRVASAQHCQATDPQTPVSNLKSSARDATREE